MANIFLTGTDRDIETAIMLDQAIVHDIGNAVAYTDGDRVFINTEDNLFRILPAYNHGMLKWLLWHEQMHKELRHHNRYFKYLDDLREKDLADKFQVNKSEVNIIMDILVHDWMCNKFPELIETAQSNLAQMRNRNSLSYTFKTSTLEEMLEEYRKHKKDSDDEKDEHKGKESKDKESKEKSKGESKVTDKKTDKKKESKDDKSSSETDKKGHKAGGTPEESKDHSSKKPEDGEPKMDDTASTPEPEHDKTDWSKLDRIDSREFIKKDEADAYIEQINKLKLKKFRLAKLTETLNGLATSTRQRTYAMPSTIQVGDGIILKGSRPGRTKLYLCFDASGSMGSELETFKDIISKSIPQAMEVPCEWFTNRYGKGKFKDIMDVSAYSGFDDDGDRTIELCWKAEQAGYSPIGVTDGGGQISWSTEKLKQLRRTILVGQSPRWLERAKKINPHIQTLDI